jgi:hypothetical protein
MVFFRGSQNVEKNFGRCHSPRGKPTFFLKATDRLCQTPPRLLQEKIFSAASLNLGATAFYPAISRAAESQIDQMKTPLLVLLFGLGLAAAQCDSVFFALPR